jgi:hypothetical protein
MNWIGMDWSNLALDKNEQLIVVKKAMNYWVS